VPAQFRVIRVCRPKYGCRTCGTVVSAPAPERPIAGAWCGMQDRIAAELPRESIEAERTKERICGLARWHF